MNELAGRVVIVTGASAGIGAGLARALAGAGATVVTVARRRELLDRLAAELPDALAEPVDLTDAEARPALVERVLERYGRVDALVNNAAATNIVPAYEEPVDDFRRLLELNLVAAFDLCRLTATSMRANGGGTIVNVSSVAGLRATGGSIPQAGYCASKAALIQLTRELAVQWAPDGIRVNAVAPGMFRSEMIDALARDHPEALEAPLARLPIRRPGEQFELDAAVLFLLSDASSYITGQVLAVDGGFTAA